MREQMDMAAGESMQRPQHFDGLRRQRHRMFLALFHPLGGNTPDRRVEVEFIPPRLYGFACGRVSATSGETR